MKNMQGLIDYQKGRAQASYDLDIYGNSYVYEQLDYGLNGKNRNFVKGYTARAYEIRRNVIKYGRN